MIDVTFLTEQRYEGERTHGETKRTVEVLAECQPTYDADNAAFLLAENIPVLEAGETYIVNWNGTEYTCIGQDVSAIVGSDGVVAVGNLSTLGMGDTGEPFTIISGGDATDIVALDGSTELTLSIKQEQTVITPLPVKYLHPSVPWVEESMVEILPDFQPTWDEAENDYVYQGTAVATAGFKSGKTYLVNWNGVEYSCVAQDVSETYGSGAVALGDIYRLSDGNIGTAATGEPFCIIVLVGYGVMLVTPFDGATEMTISIKGEKETIRKVDTRCLPEGYPYVEMGGMAEIPLTSYSEDEDGDGVPEGCYITTPLSLTVGTTYILKWGGVEYSCVAQDVSALVPVPSAAAIGNLGATGAPGFADTGEPFLLLAYGADMGEGIYGAVTPTNGTLDENFTLYGRSEIVHKIDQKFLHGSIYTVVFDADGDNTSAEVVADKEFAEVSAMVNNPDVLVRALLRIHTQGTVGVCLSLSTVQYINGHSIEFTAHSTPYTYFSLTMESDGTVKYETVDYKYNNT